MFGRNDGMVRYQYINTKFAESEHEKFQDVIWEERSGFDRCKQLGLCDLAC